MTSRFRYVLVLLVPLGLLVPSAQSGEHSYMGTKNCRKCHLKEWKSWADTTMAKAFEQLKPGAAAEAKTKAGLDPAKDYTTDATCLACHTTGYGQPGGTYTKPEHMSLKNKSYKKAEVVAVGLVDTVGAEQCTVCHNAESPFVAEGFVFDFEVNREKGAHKTFALKYEH